MSDLLGSSCVGSAVLRTFFARGSSRPAQRTLRFDLSKRVRTADLTACLLPGPVDTSPLRLACTTSRVGSAVRTFSVHGSSSVAPPRIDPTRPDQTRPGPSVNPSTPGTSYWMLGGMETARKRPWRWYLHLGVRQLMLVVLAVAGCLGWWLHRARVQRQAVAAIQAARGWVKYEWDVPGAPRRPGGAGG